MQVQEPTATPGPTLDERSRALVERVLAGEEDAWSALVGLLWPVWVSLARSKPAIAKRPAPDDAAADVALRVLERLRDGGYRRLRLYPPWQDGNPERGFLDWMRIVTANVCRDYLRETLGTSTRLPDGTPSPKRLLNQFFEHVGEIELGARPPMTDVQTARELLEFAREHLPRQQHAALALWITGAGFPDIAEGLALSPDEAERSVRAAISALRRRFIGQR